MAVSDATRKEAAAVAHELQQVLARAWPSPATTPAHASLWLYAALDLTVAIAREMGIGRLQLATMLRAMWDRATAVHGGPGAGGGASNGS